MVESHLFKRQGMLSDGEWKDYFEEIGASQKVRRSSHHGHEPVIWTASVLGHLPAKGVLFSIGPDGRMTRNAPPWPADCRSETRASVNAGPEWVVGGADAPGASYVAGR
jgi:hypothetical protein